MADLNITPIPYAQIGAMRGQAIQEVGNTLGKTLIDFGEYQKLKGKKSTINKALNELIAAGIDVPEGDRQMWLEADWPTFEKTVAETMQAKNSADEKIADVEKQTGVKPVVPKIRLGMDANKWTSTVDTITKDVISKKFGSAQMAAVENAAPTEKPSEVFTKAVGAEVIPGGGTNELQQTPTQLINLKQKEYNTEALNARAKLAAASLEARTRAQAIRTSQDKTEEKVKGFMSEQEKIRVNKRLTTDEITGVLDKMQKVQASPNYQMSPEQKKTTNELFKTIMKSYNDELKAADSTLVKIDGYISELETTGKIKGAKKQTSGTVLPVPKTTSTPTTTIPPDVQTRVDQIKAKISSITDANKIAQGQAIIDKLLAPYRK